MLKLGALNQSEIEELMRAVRRHAKFDSDAAQGKLSEEMKAKNAAQC